VYLEPPHKTIHTESNRRENAEESGNHWCDVGGEERGGEGRGGEGRGGEGRGREGRANFLNRPPTEKALRLRIDKWNFMKLKIICSEKNKVNYTNH
jgi:hypothetical protein